MTVLPGVCLAFYNAMMMKIYMDTFLEQRKQRWKAAGWLLFMIWQTIVNSRVWGLNAEGVMSEQNPGINLLVNLATMEAVGLCAYCGKMWKRLVFPVIYCALWMMAEGLVLFGVGCLPVREPSMTVYQLITNVLVLIVTLGIRYFVPPKGTAEISHSDGNIIMLFACSGITLYYAIYKMAREAGTGKTEVLLWLFISASMLLALDLCIYPIYGKLAEAYWSKRNNSEYLNQIKRYKEQRELEESAREEVARIKHDMKNNLVYLSNLLQHQELDKLQAVLMKLLGDLHEKSYLEGRTGILAIDSQINFLWQEAGKKNINLHTVTELSDVPDMEDTEICVLLGNLFDNAIEASEKISQEREIWVDLNYNKGFMKLSVRNRYNGKVTLDNRGMPKSTKEGGHGYGIRLVEKIVSKFQGHMEIVENGDVFEVKMVLYC